MRNNKIIIALALVFALLAAFMAYYLLNSVKQSTLNQQYIQVVAAVQDIPPNTALKAEMLEMKNFPKDLQTGKELTDTKAAVGRVTPVAISKGEYLLDNRLVKPGESTQRLSYAVPPGMRAMSLPVNEVTGVSNMIKVGDHVDIVAVIPAGNTNTEPRSTLVLQNLQVLAVNSNYKDTAAPEQNAAATTVTVAVDPQSALKLKLAIQGTNIALTLRPAADNNIVTPTPVTISQF